MGRNPSEDQQVNILHFSIQVYYDDNDVLCDFWQYFVTEQKDFSDPLDIWLRHFTKPFGKSGALHMTNLLTLLFNQQKMLTAGITTENTGESGYLCSLLPGQST